MIRKINNDDEAMFILLSQKFYSSTAVDHLVSKDNFFKTFKECLNENPYCHGVMVEYEKNIVGFGLIALTYSNEAGGLVVWLEELYILEEFRSKGLGKELFEYAYTTFPNAKRFRLEVTPVNTRAINLYKSLGYEILDYIQMYKDINHSK